MKSTEKIENVLFEHSGHEIFVGLMNELHEGLLAYVTLAGGILAGSGVLLKTNDPSYFTLEKNLFSLIFLYSFYRAGIPGERRVLYATVNQCLRGMVTGCDNILDDEYKITLDTSLPKNAHKFRSILDIMVSDRVLCHLLQAKAADGTISHEAAGRAVDETLRALLKSGAQEASEEGGVNEFLLPDQVLSSVHHDKTGVLFQSPWAVPSVIEAKGSHGRFEGVKTALYDIGMGCQVMDDMVDLANDIRDKRHNYLASLIFHGASAEEKDTLVDGMITGTIAENGRGYAKKFPIALQKAAHVSSEYLKRGMSRLFKDEHAFMGDFSIEFITKQIGAEDFVTHP